MGAPATASGQPPSLRALAPDRLELRVRCQHGAYVKEWISGDEGRTEPSLRALLGAGGCPRALAPLAAVGRLALTNYLLQSLIGTFVFYGHGLGLYGRLERTEQIGVVVTVWALQLIASPLWLRVFRFGPLEWIWRSLTYGKLQPFLR